MIMFFKCLSKFPKFFYMYIVDLYVYYKDKLYLNFEGWGLHLYVGRFGSGKTFAMVERAYRLAKHYKQLTIVTNLALNNFPSWTTILPLTSPDDILNAPQNTLVLIDEIGTIFNSRDFASKNALPKILFQHICQCRKRRLQILATTQCWNFLDKQLRDITAYVITCRGHFSHPFTRLVTCREYDAIEYDMAFSSPLLPITPCGISAVLQTNFKRSLYDTSELIESIMTKKYISDEKILQNRGEIITNVVEIDKKTKIKIK